MDIIHNANLSALRTAIAFMLPLGSSRNLHILQKPQILRYAVASLLHLLSLAYACVLFKTWLGFSSKSVPFVEVTPYNGSLPFMSRQINNTLCEASGDPSGTGTYLCGIYFSE
jgi:hypothetical protein